MSSRLWPLNCNITTLDTAAVVVVVGPVVAADITTDSGPLGETPIICDDRLVFFRILLKNSSFLTTTAVIRIAAGERDSRDKR